MFTDEIKESLPHSASHTLLDDLLTSCREEEFKPTVEIITKAMIDHRLEEFMISCDSLTILKGLGEGEKTHMACMVLMLNWCSSNPLTLTVYCA